MIFHICSVEGKNELSFLCAGAIISSKYVLTAANCLDPESLGKRRLDRFRFYLRPFDFKYDYDCDAAYLKLYYDYFFLFKKLESY
ncbi:hypothetical protein Avbf_16833 [Armadillidium vulgare]|nr:hypothetical protein Avbf_16833 [Armadillidium vulgare]